MSNISAYFPLVNGGVLDLVEKGQPPKAVVNLITDDVNPPPRSLTIEITTKSGKLVKVVIPYANNDTAVVLIDGEKVE